MAIGIRLSDMMRTVSPSCVLEIQKPGRKPKLCSGDKLESDLKFVFAQDRSGKCR